MHMDVETAKAVLNLRTNPNFKIFVEWLSQRGEDNTKKAIYTDGSTGDVAKGMARESIEIMKGIAASVSIVEQHRDREE